MPVDPNHPEWKGFAAAMRADPADDTPRLVFADWLMERGFEAFARLIRAMVEVATFDPANRLNTWGWENKDYRGTSRMPVYAEAELCMKSAWAGWSPLKDLHNECRLEWWFHRGFPDTVVLDWRGLKYLDHLCAIGPVGEVEVVRGSPVEAKVFPQTIHFALDDPSYHTRLANPVFIIDRKDTLVGSYVPRESLLFHRATSWFLRELWGDKVIRIEYRPRRNLKVWPAAVGDSQIQ